MPQTPITRRDDLALVERLLEGESAAFDHFAETYFPALYRFALSRLGHDEDMAADIVQSTLTAAIRRLDSFRGDAALLTWLCGICRFEISGLRRRKSRAPVEVALSEEISDVRSALDDAARQGTNQHAELERKETAHLVHQVLDLLPPHYGQALEWKYLQGLSVKEIAARQGVGPKAAESVLTRARVAFLKSFEAHDGAGGRLLGWPAGRRSAG